MKTLPPLKLQWTNSMAHKPTSLMGWRDRLLPAVRRRLDDYRGLSVEIYNDYASDNILLLACCGDRSHQGVLLTRVDIDGGIPDLIAIDNFDRIIAKVLPPQAPSEYDDIMAGQAIMDELRG